MTTAERERAIDRTAKLIFESEVLVKQHMTPRQFSTHTKREATRLKAVGVTGDQLLELQAAVYQSPKMRARMRKMFREYGNPITNDELDALAIRGMAKAALEMKRFGFAR